MVTREESVPAKSDGYLYAQSAFFVQFNDVDFYVEDQDSESLYYAIFSCLFPDVKLERIFPLGGKRAVIEHAQSRKNPNSIYVLDKDFDDLLSIQIRLSHLFYLDRLCIENYLLEVSAIARFVIAEKPKLIASRVNNLFDIDGFLQSSMIALRRLFFYFFLVQKHGIALENTSSPLARFTRDHQSWRIDQKKVAAYQEKFLAEAAHTLPMNLVGEQKRYSKAFELKRKRLIGYNISGKYLLALVLRKISSVFRLPGTNLNSAAYRLAEYCSFSSLASFQREVSKSVARRKRHRVIGP